MHEASLYEANCSLTLTYDAEHLRSMSLEYPDYQDFMRKLRLAIAPERVRFFMCGEYGELYSRPHFHACIFGFSFPDRVYLRKSPAGFDLFSSKLLSGLWPHGEAAIGDLTFESAAYAARYVMKKLTGDGEKDYYNIYDPSTGEIVVRRKEFCHMSLKPGIGRDWFDRFHTDVREGRVVVNGVEAVAPRYYMRRLEKLFPDRYEDVVSARREFESNQRKAGELRPERVAVKEVVSKARVRQLKRSL